MKRTTFIHSTTILLVAFFVTAGVSAQIDLQGDENGLRVNGKTIDSSDLPESFSNVIEGAHFALHWGGPFPMRVAVNDMQYEVWEDRIVESDKTGNVNFRLQIRRGPDSSYLGMKISSDPNLSSIERVAVRSVLQSADDTAEILDDTAEMFEDVAEILEDADWIFDEAAEVFDDADEIFDDVAKIFDDTDEIFDNADEIFDDADERFDEAVEILDDVVEIFDDAAEVFDGADERFDEAVEILDEAIEILDDAAEVFDDAAEIFDEADEILQDSSWQEFRVAERLLMEQATLTKSQVKAIAHAMSIAGQDALRPLELSNYMADVLGANDELSELLRYEWREEFEARQMAARIRDIAPGRERDVAIAELREKLETIFSLKQDNRVREIRRLRLELEKMQLQVRERNQAKERLIDARLDELLGTGR